MASADAPDLTPAGPRRPAPTVALPPAARIPRQRRADQPAIVDRLAELARAGAIGSAMASADDAERRRLYTAAYALCHPIVFEVVTRRVERRRGHLRCRRGLRYLTGPCLDGFHDDVEALVDHLLAATTPIDDLRPWLAFWAPRAAVDGHRRRRGALGALQRPRMTAALATALGHDPWLMNLALEMLIWVGIPATAGAELWPLDEWAERRSLITGDHAGSNSTVVAADIEQVLAVMRKRPAWYLAHVELPLGRKPAPVAASPGDGVDDRRPLRTVDDHDLDDAHVVVLAGLALEAIVTGLRRDGDPAAVVVRTLRTLFLGGSGAEELGRAPAAGPALDERLSVLLADPAAVDRIVERVLRIVREVEQ